MNAFRVWGCCLVMLGGMLAGVSSAAEPVTQYRSFSYEPAAAAPVRTNVRSTHHFYGKPAYAVQKSLR